MLERQRARSREAGFVFGDAGCCVVRDGGVGARSDSRDPCNGGTFGGYSFFINKDQKLQYSHNYVAINEYKVISTEKVPTGKVTLRMEFKKTGPPDFKIGKGTPGNVTLYINDKAVGSGDIADTCPIGYSLSGDGLSVGRDTLSAVSLDYMGSNFPFTGGVIRRVTVDIGNDQHPTPKAPERD